MHTFVIAEMGSCHGGSLERAAELVHIAKVTGADAVKSQYWSDSAKLAARYNAPERAAFYEKLRMPFAWIPELSRLARDQGLQFACSLDLPEDIAPCSPYFDLWKIASFNALDRAFIAAHFAFPKPLYISTGLMDEAMVRDLHDWLWANARPRRIRWTLLHCVSGYPVPPDQLNLTVLQQDGNPVPMVQGFSDHSRRLEAGGIAVAAGAQVVEVHFCPFDAPPNHPDAPVAFDPGELGLYIRAVRDTERLLGTGPKRIMACEQPWLGYRVRP